MDHKLWQLFNYQKFDGDRELQQEIDSVHAKYAARELSFADMEMVNAAGIPDPKKEKKDGEQ